MTELLRKQIGISVRNLFQPVLRRGRTDLEPAANGGPCEVAGRPTSPILPSTSAFTSRSRLCSSTVVPALLTRSRPVDVLSFECISANPSEPVRNSVSRLSHISWPFAQQTRGDSDWIIDGQQKTPALGRGLVTTRLSFHHRRSSSSLNCAM